MESVADLDTVPFAGVRLYAEGVYPREPVPAITVKTKRLNRIREGDIVYNRMWVTKSSFGVAGSDSDGCLVTNDFPVFQPIGKRVTAKYIALIFKWRPFQAAAAAAATGTTERRRLNERDFMALRVPLPRPEQQRRVVNLIGAATDAVDAASAAAAAMAQQRAAITAAAASSGDVVKVDLLAEVSQGRSLPMKVQGSRSGDVPWFKISDMAKPPNLYGFTTAETRLPANDIRDLGGRLLPPGSIVFPRVGAAVRTEKKRILDVTGAVDENHIVLAPRDGVPAEVLLAVIENLSLSSLVQDGAVPSLNMKLVRGTSLPWPQESVLPALSEALHASRTAARAAAGVVRDLSQLRLDLMNALLSGEHEIPESYDDLMEA